GDGEPARPNDVDIERPWLDATDHDRLVVARPALAHVELRHLRRRAHRAELAATAGDAHRAGDAAALAVPAAREVAGYGRANVVAIQQLRVFGADGEVDADPARGGEIEGAGASDGPFVGGALETGELEPRAIEPAGRIHVGDHHAGDGALEAGAPCAHQA